MSEAQRKRIIEMLKMMTALQRAIPELRRELEALIK